MKKQLLHMNQILSVGALLLFTGNVTAQCPVPAPVTASPASLCPGGTSSLNATAGAASIAWYTVAVGGTPIGVSPGGANFPVSPVNTATYYAESFSVSAITNTFNYTGSLQNFTVPVGVTQLTITAIGASGGSVVTTCSAQGGRGTRMSGEFAVTPGQVLSILVGQMGISNGSDAGGGGGSYVVLTPGNTPWLVAGGGGGATNNIGQCGGNRNGIDAVVTNNGTASGDNLVAGGVAGNGGGASGGSGSGGAGWLGNGVSGAGNPNGNGKSYLNGGAGGIGSNNNHGGYGGGGCGWHTGGNGGGGGGYSGGATSSAQPFTGGGGAGSYNIGANQVNAAGIGTGNGTVTIAYTTTVCVSASRAPIVVTIYPSPVISVNSGSICPGSSFTINPSGANTYTIQGGNAIVSPTVNATYTVIGTSTAGCVSQTFATSSVTINTTPLPTVSVNSGSICSGQSFTLNPSGANAYSIQGGTAVVSPTVNATYTVIGTNSVGCASTVFATANITVNALPNVSVTGTSTICTGGTTTLTANGANTYSWNTGATTASVVLSPPATTNYTVTGTSSVTGCAKTVTLALLVDPCTGLSSYVSSNGGLVIYPNPTVGDFIVETVNGSEKTIQVTDILGKVVLKKTFSSEKINVTISDLPAGTYYVKVQTANSIETVKILKQ